MLVHKGGKIKNWGGECRDVTPTKSLSQNGGGGPVGGGGGSVAEGVRWRGGGVGGAGVRVDVNAMLGVGGDVGYGGCEPRIEGIVQCTKRYCTILRK